VRRHTGNVTIKDGMLETEDARGNHYQLEIQNPGVIHDFGFSGLGFWQLTIHFLQLS
jgi:hypothetical protein